MALPWPKQRWALLWSLNRAAMRFWHETLLATPAALEYLASRGWTDPVGLAKTYGLGYAPGRGDRRPSFVRTLLEQGFPGTTDRADLEHALIAAGLARRDPRDPETGPLRDFFYGRIMFPIATSGTLLQLWAETTRVAGFAGRVIPAQAVPRADGREPPKYINTPETEIFHKGRTLYGLSWAEVAVRTSKRVVIIEGYLDYIRLRETGVTNIAACCGTALTPEHMRQLKRVANELERAPRVMVGATTTRAPAKRPALEVTLMTDADPAGRRAAERGARVVLQAGVRAKIATFGGGKDPDEVLRDMRPEAGRALVQQVLDEAQTPIMNYLDVLADASGGVPPWGGSLRALVTTLRNVQRRAAGAPESVLRVDAERVAGRFRVEGRFALEVDNILDLFRRGSTHEFDDDAEVGG